MGKMSGNRNAFAVTISRQYGAWSILLACFVLGTSVGEGLNPRVPLMFCVVIFGFLARNGAEAYLRAPKTDERRSRLLIWTAVYSLVVLIAGALLVMVHELWQLIPLGLLILGLGSVTLFLSQRRLDTTTGGELIGILALTLVAPAAEYAAGGIFSTRTVGLWILCALFFCASVFHVRYLVRRRADSMGPPRLRLEAGWRSVAYHLAALCLSMVLGFAGLLPLLSPVAILPAAVRAWIAVARRVEKPLPVRRIGVMEVLNTVAFLVLAFLVFHLS